MQAPKIKVIPNFAPEVFHRQVFEALSNFNLPWALRPSTMYPGYVPPAHDSNAYESPQFIHPVYDDGRPTSGLSSMIDNMGWMLSAREGVYTGKIHRSKVNLTCPAPHIPEGGHYMPHKDIDDVPHIVALYYVNDADGDTVFFEEMAGELREMMRVTPRANTMVCFDGNIFHAAEPPRKSPMRLVINTDYVQIETQT
jgi:hypothetical protein